MGDLVLKKRRKTRLSKAGKKICEVNGDPLTDYLIVNFFRHPITPVLHPKKLIEGYISTLVSILPPEPWVRVVRGGVTPPGHDNYLRTYLSLFDCPPSISLQHKETRILMGYIIEQARYWPVVVRVVGIQTFGIVKAFVMVKLLLLLEFY